MNTPDFYVDAYQAGEMSLIDAITGCAMLGQPLAPVLVQALRGAVAEYRRGDYDDLAEPLLGSAMTRRERQRARTTIRTAIALREIDRAVRAGYPKTDPACAPYGRPTAFDIAARPAGLSADRLFDLYREERRRRR